jgi:hypothetical protein
MKNALNFGTPIKLRELATADEPTPVAKGGLFYNSNYNTYRIYDNAVWDNIISQSVFNAEVADLQSQITAAPSKLEWQNSVKDIVAVLPGSPAVGDRYLLNAGAHINEIAEYTATGWIYSVPGVAFGGGTFVGVDAVAEGVYFWGWDTNQVSFSWVAKAWENPVFSDGLDLDLAGGAPGVLKVLAKDLTIVVDAFGVAVGTITDSNIVDNTISGDKLLYASVDSVKLIDNNVSGTKLLYASVDGVKLIDSSVHKVKLNSDVWTYIQDSVVLFDGTSIKKDGSNQLYVNKGDGLETTTDLHVLAKDLTIVVDAFGVAVGTITDSNIADNTISGDKLLYASVDGVKLIDNSVSGDKLLYASVDGVKLIDNSVHQVKLHSDVWTYIQDSVVLYDDVTIGKNGSKQLYVKDSAITNAKLAVELDTATKAVKIMGAEGLFVSRLRLNVDNDYAKYAEETYVHAISLTGTATVTELSSLSRAVVEYSIKLGSDYRVGTLYITPESISDEFVEDADLGITWAISSGAVSVTVAAGTGAMSCTIKKFID